MFVRAETKQRFGDAKIIYLNINHIVSVEPGHDFNINLRMSNNEELVVSGEEAKKLAAWLDRNRLQ